MHLNICAHCIELNVTQIIANQIIFACGFPTHIIWFLSVCQFMNTTSVALYCIAAAPDAPNLSVTAKLNELVLGCCYGDEAVKCNVTIEINGTVVSIAANATFYGLVSNTLYPIHARAINRCGDYSETSTSHWTCKV